MPVKAWYNRSVIQSLGYRLGSGLTQCVSKSTPMVDLPDLFSLSWLFKVKAVLGIYVKKNETLANVWHVTVIKLMLCYWESALIVLSFVWGPHHYVDGTPWRCIYKGTNTGQHDHVKTTWRGWWGHVTGFSSWDLYTVVTRYRSKYWQEACPKLYPSPVLCWLLTERDTVNRLDPFS